MLNLFGLHVLLILWHQTSFWGATWKNEFKWEKKPGTVQDLKESIQAKIRRLGPETLCTVMGNFWWTSNLKKCWICLVITFSWFYGTRLLFGGLLQRTGLSGKKSWDSSKLKERIQAQIRRLGPDTLCKVMRNFIEWGGISEQKNGYHLGNVIFHT